MFSDNLKYLRKTQGLSQQNVADTLQIPRTTLGDYERGHTEPSIDMLQRISALFDVRIDALIKQDLSLNDLELIRNKDVRILAISVDQENHGNIEMVESTARAGYLQNFQNPEFIKDLPKIHFPAMPQGTYRGFEIEGDSMLPLEPGSVVISQYVERLQDLKEGNTYVVVTHDDGIVYKRIFSGQDSNSLTLTSDNDQYKPYQVHYNEIAEIWRYYAHLSFSDARVSIESLLDHKLQDIQQKVSDLHCHLMESS